MDINVIKTRDKAIEIWCDGRMIYDFFIAKYTPEETVFLLDGKMWYTRSVHNELMRIIGVESPPDYPRSDSCANLRCSGEVGPMHISGIVQSVMKACADCGFCGQSTTECGHD